MVSDRLVADTPLGGAKEWVETERISYPSTAVRASSVSAAEIDLRPTEWLWPQRVPRGAITVLAGDPGLGKSLLTITLAAKLSRGELGGTPGNVLMLTAEDSLAHTVRPRLEAAQASLGRVRFGSIKRDGLDTSVLLPNDISALRGLALEHEVKLIVIDPLMAHLSAQINSWKDQMVRQALAPVHRLAEETGATAIIVAHLNKGQGSDPLQRLGGSIGIAAAARSVLLLADDPDQPGKNRRVLAHVKSNASSLAPSLLLAISAAPSSLKQSPSSSNNLREGRVPRPRSKSTPARKASAFKRSSGRERSSASTLTNSTSSKAGGGISEMTLRRSRTGTYEPAHSRGPRRHHARLAGDPA
jgi:hypothetical protein